jgi:hypothetical protein
MSINRGAHDPSARYAGTSPRMAQGGMLRNLSRNHRVVTQKNREFT